MYVCVCNAITERDIGDAVTEGCQSLRELRDQLGVATCCGRCAGCARGMLREFLRHPAIPSTSGTQMLAAA